MNKNTTITIRRRPTLDGNITTYTWTDDNQLAAVALPNSGGTVTNTYDGDGLRFSRSDSSGTNSYLWNGQVLEAQLGAGNTVSTWYTQGVGDGQRATNHEQRTTRSGEFGDIVSTCDVAGSATNWPQYDASGNVSQTTDSGAGITTTLAYDTFGVVTDNSGPASPTVAWQGKQGYQFEQPLGLQYVRQRWYDPTTQQFISPDPLRFAGGDVNLFRYAGNNPISRSDPSGESDTDNHSPIITALPQDLTYALLHKPPLPAPPRNHAARQIYEAELTYYNSQEDIPDHVITINLPRHAIGAPGFWGSLIPIYGSGRAAVNDYQTGHWGWGIFDTAMAISDIFLVKKLAMDVGEAGGKVLIRLSAETVENSPDIRQPLATSMRRWWYPDTGHHAIFPERWKIVPEWIRGSRLNVIRPFEDPLEYARWHFRVDPNYFGGRFRNAAGTLISWSARRDEGKLIKYGMARRLWYGSPRWLQHFIAGMGATELWLGGRNMMIAHQQILPVPAGGPIQPPRLWQHISPSNPPLE